MSARLRISAHAEQDIREVLEWTLRRFGAAKYDEYRDLIKAALEEVAVDPSRARHRPELHRQARTFHIGRRGRAARHFLLLRIGADGVVEIARLLYDGMDLESQLPPGYAPTGEEPG